jgi:hypothetical protein
MYFLLGVVKMPEQFIHFWIDVQSMVVGPVSGARDLVCCYCQRCLVCSIAALNASGE